jgi:predicted secreted protein
MDDGSDKEIVVLAHCLLNKSSRIKGIRESPTIDTEAMNVIQLPCPEMIYMGLNRWEITKEQVDHPNYRRFCRRLFRPFADMIEQFSNAGMRIRIIGVPKSPSCGSEVITIGGEGGFVKEFKHEHVKGVGVFFEEIENELVGRSVLFTIEDVRDM